MKTINFNISIGMEDPIPNRWNASLRHMLHLGNGCAMISTKASFVDRIIYDMWSTYNGITAKTMKDKGERVEKQWYTKR